MNGCTQKELVQREWIGPGYCQEARMDQFGHEGLCGGGELQILENVDNMA